LELEKAADLEKLRNLRTEEEILCDDMTPTIIARKPSYHSEKKTEKE
jgi:hypothetical protein